MLQWIAIGVGGLIWYAQRTQGEHALDTTMSAALRREVLELLKRDLTAEQLASLAEEFERAHYHKAKELVAARLRRLNGAAAPQRKHGPSDPGTALAGETDPAVLRRVGAVLRSTGYPDAATGVEMRAAALEQEGLVTGRGLDELLKTVTHVEPQPAARSESNGVEAELTSIEDDEPFEAESDELSGEPDDAGPAEAESEVTDDAEFARMADEFAQQGASTPGSGASPFPSSSNDPAGQGSSAEVDGSPSVARDDDDSASRADFDVPGAVIDTDGAEVSDVNPRSKASRARAIRRREGKDLGGEHGT